MSICPGCFLIRPGKARDRSLFSAGRVKSNLRESISETSNYVALHCNRRSIENVGPDAAKGETSKAMRESNEMSTGSRDGPEGETDGGVGSVEPIPSVSPENTHHEVRLIADPKDGTGAGGGVTDAVENMQSGKERFDDGLAQLQAKAIDGELDEQERLQHHGDNIYDHADDASTHKSSVNCPTEENSPLYELLLDMTKAANAFNNSEVESCNNGDGSGNGRRGVTAIILLDSPLFFEGTPQSKTQTMTISPKTPARNPRNDYVDVSSDHTSPDSDENAPVATATGEDGQQDSCRSLEEDKGVRENSKNYYSTADISEEHPAGLGDPAIALAALSSWIRDGPEPGCQGRREILLVCGSDAVDNNSGERFQQDNSKNTGGRGEVEGADTSGKSDIFAQRERSLGSTGQFAELVTGDVLEGEGAGNTFGDKNIHEQVSIRQIVLGASTIRPKSKSSPTWRMPTDSLLPAVDNALEDGTTTGVTNISRVAVDGRANTYSITDQVPVDEARSLARVDVGSAGKEDPRSPPSHLPAEVLLDIRQESTDDGAPRVFAAFPPPRPLPTTALRGSSMADPQELDDAAQRRLNDTKNRTQSAMYGGGTSCSLPRVTVGPVVGRVSPTSAVILLECRDEVSSSAWSSVGIALLDTLSGQRFEMTGGVETSEDNDGPRVFEFEGLTPGRRYMVKLVGVHRNDQVRKGVHVDHRKLLTPFVRVSTHATSNTIL